jgi:hypothetical protein
LRGSLRISQRLYLFVILFHENCDIRVGHDLWVVGKNRLFEKESKARERLFPGEKFTKGTSITVTYHFRYIYQWIWVEDDFYLNHAFHTIDEVFLLASADEEITPNGN